MDRPDAVQRSKVRPRLRLGRRLTRDAYLPNGLLLLSAGSVIDSRAWLARLSDPGVWFGPDKSRKSPRAPKAPDSSTESIAEFTAKLKRAEAIKAEAIDDVELVFARIISGGGPVDETRRIVASLLEQLLDEPRALVSLTQVKDVDNYTFTHCVNVCIMAMYIAITANVAADVEEIGTGALLHDVGKVSIPLRVLNKSAPLNTEEMALIKKHPIMGMEMITRSGKWSGTVMSCVLDHHEKIDGSGYPNGKKGNSIDIPARVTALADVYDALTTDRAYRNAMNPREAMLVMMEWMSAGLDRQLLSAFVASVGYFPVGSHVELSNGCTAIVTSNNPADPLRPQVKLTSSARGLVVVYGQPVDLGMERDLYVKKFISASTPATITRRAAA